MKKLVAAAIFLVLLPNTGFACSLVMSPGFHPRAGKQASRAPPEIEVRNVNFVPWINHDGTCDGVGFIAIELSGLSARETRNHGFLIRALSGVNDEALFPTSPLSAERTEHGGARISWAWTGITPDQDGHVRWLLEITPVSRSGVWGVPVTACAASDGSCPQPE